MDTINIEILEDGTIKIEADKVSQANHLSAEQLLHETVKLAGGPSKVTKKQGHVHHGQKQHHHH